jgi:hypothetical protein
MAKRVPHAAAFTQGRPSLAGAVRFGRNGRRLIAVARYVALNSERAGRQECGAFLPFRDQRSKVINGSIPAA